MNDATPTQTHITDEIFAQAQRIAIRAVRSHYEEDHVESCDNDRQEASDLSDDMHLSLDYAAYEADEDADMRKDWLDAVAHFRERARTAEVDFLVEMIEDSRYGNYAEIDKIADDLVDPEYPWGEPDFDDVGTFASFWLQGNVDESCWVGGVELAEYLAENATYPL